MTKERLDKIKAISDTQKAKTKDKEFKTLSTTEKWELVETIGKILGLIKSE